METNYMLPDYIETPLVIATMLFVAWKIEWCAKQVWRMLRIVLPVAGVLFEIMLLQGAPAFGVAVLIVIGVATVYQIATYERRRQARNLHAWQCGLTPLGPQEKKPSGAPQ